MNKSKSIIFTLDATKYFIATILVLFILLPLFSFAQSSQNPTPLVTKECGILVNGKLNRECGWTDFLALINRVINWVIWMAIPFSAAVFAWAGFKYMTSGVVDQKKEAIEMMQKVFWGLVAILSAWLIVDTILDALLSDAFKDVVNLE